MGSLRAVVALLLVAGLAGLASAADYGVVSTLNFSLAPGESATQSQEVSKCRVEGCADTLRLTATVPPDFAVLVNPPELNVQNARVGQAFSANVTLGAKVTASPGRYEGSLRVTSGSGDTWSYTLSITVRRASAAVPAAQATQTPRPSPGAGGLPGIAPAAPGATGGGSGATLPAVAGGVVVVVLLLLVLRRLGLLPRGAPLSRGPGRGARDPLPQGSPMSAVLRPLGSIGASVAGLLKRPASKPGPPSPRNADPRMEQEWERLVHERLPSGAGAHEAAEAPMEAPLKEGARPVAGEVPPEAARSTPGHAVVEAEPVPGKVAGAPGPVVETASKGPVPTRGGPLGLLKTVIGRAPGDPGGRTGTPEPAPSPPPTEAGMSPDGLLKELGELRGAAEEQRAGLAALATEVEALRAERGPGPGVALQADLEALRNLLGDHRQLMERMEARLKNHELTFARGDEVRSLFRDLSALREDLAAVRMRMEEEGLRPVASLAEAPPRAPAEAPAPQPPAPVRREAPDAAAIRREVEQEAEFLNSLEEYHRSGLMPEQLYLEKKRRSEERLRDLKGRAGT